MNCENASINELVAAYYMVGWIQDFWAENVLDWYGKRNSYSNNRKYVIRTIPEATKVLLTHFNSYLYRVNENYRITGIAYIDSAGSSRPFELIYYHK